MSIIFKEVFYANFLSTGSAGNRIRLNQHASSLISAKNGSGKSTILDAIIFALFGKPFRDINKNQLINSINGKACLVELSFDIDANNYLIRRGIKPAIFEIFENGKLIDQEAAVKDYQKFLEAQILKTNIKAFTQSAILGTANFVPFMQMKPHERREVIEDFLDVKIFGVMNQILKGEISETKGELNRIDSKFSVVKTKVDAQKKLIIKMEEANAQAEAQLRAKIDEAKVTVSNLEFDIEMEMGMIQELRDQIGAKTRLSSEIQKTEDALHAKRHSKNSTTKNLKFFDKTSECPSCQQTIGDDYKKPIIKELITEYENTEVDIKALELLMNEQQLRLKQIWDIEDDIMVKVGSVQSMRNNVTLNNKNVAQWENEIASLTVTDILDEKTKLKELASEAVSIIEEKTKLSDHRAIQDQAYNILKDSGVKTTIIKEYLPIINQLINKYLGIMDFYVDFNLDESFSEVIRSRGRDEFTYSSFSEGEKKRLDIAILFAWRHVAKLKNSVNCNILFLDEVLESGLDETGLDAVFEIIEEESLHSNVFTISHADRFKDRFNNVITISKVGDFSIVQ